MDALACLDAVSVTGRNNRMNMLLAEQHIADVAQELTAAETAKKNDKEAADNGNV
jgi:hypothetical protein